MIAPLVALTTYPNRDGRDHVELPRSYHEAIRRAGGRPMLVPPGETDVVGLLDIVDAVVLTGGGDIDPELSGAGDHPTIYAVDRERDDFEIEVARAAVEREMPMLAICRGMQVVNVALGGTLNPHVPDVHGDSVAHRSDPPGPLPHDVEVDAVSVIARAMTSTAVTPASWHHQSVATLGIGLRITATAPDGTVEAIELDGHRRLAATQWHPEITAADDPTQQALFDSLVTWARS